MNLKIIKQLTNQLEVLQELEAGNYVLSSGVKQQDKVESGRLLKLDSDSFGLVEHYYCSSDKEPKFEKARVLPDFTENDYVYSCKESNWYDEITKQGILCWVSDKTNPGLTKYNESVFIHLIKEYDGSFVALDGSRWLFAKPMTKQELIDFTQDFDNV